MESKGLHARQRSIEDAKVVFHVQNEVGDLCRTVGNEFRKAEDPHTSPVNLLLFQRFRSIVIVRPCDNRSSPAISQDMRGDVVYNVARHCHSASPSS